MKSAISILNHLQKVFSGRVLFVVALGLISALYIYKFFLLIKPIEFLITNVTYDDAYYYFEIARHIAAGAGSTFDGISQTNGYHPLWMLLILPLFYFLPGLVAPVHGALLLGLVFDIAATVTLYCILRTFTSRIAIIAPVLIVWVVTPINFFLTVNGLETALAVFLVLLFTLQLIQATKYESTRAYVFLGIIAGFMMLARTDYVFIAGAPFIIWLISQAPLRKLKYIAPYMIPAVILVSPWLIWNIATFGTPVQVSGVAFAEVQHQLVEYANPNLSPLVRHLKAGFGDLAQGIPTIVAHTGAGFIYLVLLGGLWGFVLGKRRREDNGDTSILHTLIGVSVGIVLLFFFHTGFRLALRDWYFIPLMNILPLLWVAYGAERAFVVSQVSIKALPVFIAFVCVCSALGLNFLYDYWQEYRISPRIESHEGFVAGYTWINEYVPADARVGVLNAGIIGYFSEATVVNLDGLVNNRAYEAIRSRRLYEYAAKDLDLDYLVDWDNAITFKFSQSWGVPILERLEKVETFYGKEENYTSMSAYQFKD